MRKALLRIVRKSSLGTSALLVLTNYLAKLQLLRGDIGCDSGMPHAGKDVSESVRYIDRVFADYREQAGVGRFHGRVAEIGPGDSCGVALRFLEDGCSDIDLVDRFWSRRDDAQQILINREIIERSAVLRSRCGDSVQEGALPSIHRHYGENASAEAYFAAHGSYDFIVSRAVLEHVRDPVLSLQRQGDALAPEGMLLHAVDLRDHGMFSNHGYEDTKFLETSLWLHRAMTVHCGRPNRVPLSRYRDALDPARFDVAIKVTNLVGCGKLEMPARYEDVPVEYRDRALAVIRSNRHGFAGDLAAESDADLSISGIFLIARKRLLGVTEQAQDERSRKGAGNPIASLALQPGIVGLFGGRLP